MTAEVEIVSGGAVRRESVECPVLLSQVLRLHGEGPDMPCGGKGRCGQCRVRASGALSPVSPAEQKFLSQADLDAGIRLACLAYVEGPVRVEPAETLLENISIDAAMPAFPEAPVFKGYGAAFDIGTTTLAAWLFQAGDGNPVATASMKNPQAAYGADVISRIGHAMAGGGEELFQSVSSALDRMLRSMAQRAGIAPKQVDAMVVTGNTAMMHLFAKQDPSSLSHAPFEAERLFGEQLKGNELGFLSAPDADVYLPRCISAFVGADITTAVLASGMEQSQGPALLVDIGTNGEMALLQNGAFSCCSTAAGPAFEGAGIRMGMPGAKGAIDSVAYQDGKLLCTVIGGGTPKGICGSGIVDAVAAMVVSGVIDETGAIQEDGHPFPERVIDIGDEPAFLLHGGVSLTQKDIRMVQLAKSAVCAGMRTLLERAEIVPESITSLFIAGGFGSYLNLDSAARMGLIPEELREKAVVIGNAALGGASMVLRGGFGPRTEAMAKSAKTLDLASDPVFMDYYVECMMFE